MGLLDSLFTGQGGGLLDFLRNNAVNQQMAGGLPSDQAQYSAPAQPTFIQANQPSPLDTAQWPQGPIGAPSAIPQNAQPAQGQLPQQQGFGGFLQSLNENFQNMGNGGSIIGALTGQQPNNQTAQFLVSKGIEPALAKTIVSDPSLLRSVLPSLIGTGGQTDDIKEYQFAKRENPSLTFEKFMAGKRATSGEYGMTPMFTYNEKTKQTEAWQLGKDGKPRKVELPEGSAIARGVEKIDTGTEIITINKQTGETISRTPKDIEGKESAEERGKAKGLAQAALPNVIANAEQTLQIIQSVKNDPYRERGTGASSFFNAIPATGGYDFAQKLEQLKGKAFLEAFQALKGGGAITEIEGKKAENAIARLSPGQSEGAFLQALNELEQVVTAGIERAKARAGQGGAPAAAASGGGSASSAVAEGATATNPQTGQKITFRNGKWQ